jgi:nitrogenase subunit NifH
MFVDNRTSESQHNLEVLCKRFGDKVLTPVPVRTRMREAIAEGATIFEYAPRDDIAEIYQSLVATVIAVATQSATKGAA